MKSAGIGIGLFATSLAYVRWLVSHTGRRWCIDHTWVTVAIGVGYISSYHSQLNFVPQLRLANLAYHEK